MKLTKNVAMMMLESAKDALQNDMPFVAAAWADSAADAIREAALTSDEPRALIAPHEGPTRGDKAVMVCVILVLVWLLADTIGGLL